MAVRIKTVLAAGGALAILASPFAASSSTIVFGNGYAGNCSREAIRGESDNNVLAICNRAIEQELLTTDDYAKTLVNRGVVHMRRQNLAAATRDFSRAEKVLPNLPEIFINRAVILIKQGKYKEAVAEADHGIALRPEQLEKAYFNRALAREAAGDIKGAYLDFSKAVELRPDFEPARKELTRFNVQRG